MTSCSNKSAKLEIHCYKSCSQLPDLWDSFIPANHYLNRSNLLLDEDAGLPYIVLQYVIITKNELPVAAAYFQILSIKREHLNEELLKPVQKIGWRICASIFSPKLLVAGHLFRHDIASFYVAANMDAFESYRLYKAAIDEALKETCSSAVLIKDVPPKLVTYFQHYAPQYLTLRNDISMELNLESTWNTIADYEKALKHKYAQRYRKVRGGWDKVKIEELSVEKVFEHKKRLYELYKQVCQKQPARIGMLNEGYIPLLKKHYPEMLKVWGIYYEDKLIGFYSAWIKGDVFDMFYIGFDYAHNQQLQLYFNILFCTIDEAIKLGKKKLVLGRTALDAKARLGCKPHYLSTFMFIKNRFIRMLVQQLQTNAQNQEGGWEQRHPMKNG